MVTRISKACHECRTRKVRCNGEQPCDHCAVRGTHCVYRAKPRNRLRRTANASDLMSHDGSVVDGNVDANAADGNAADGHGVDGSEVDRAINTHSVAATHRASPSCLLQLYYGPSSMFTLMHSIYHQIEGSPPNTPSREGVEEMGPGLDLFSHRRLFFGDLADTQSSRRASDAHAAVFLGMETAAKFLERYLATYWYGFPAISKNEYRRRLSTLLRPPAIIDVDSAENIATILAIAMGAYMLGQDAIADFLYQRAKQGAAKLDEAVNVQMVQVYLIMAQIQLERAYPNSAFLHMGTAVRRAIAAGLHRDTGGRAADGQQEIDQRRITFWSLLFWETWSCFALGRPRSVPVLKDNVPMPKDQPFLQSMANLSRIISKCMDHIYAPRHDSVLPVWKYANEIRVELRQFAEQLPQTLGFDLRGDVMEGELGICQTMLSTMYHHTLQLTFRPFLVLRAKLRQRKPDATSLSQSQPDLPPWLDKACEFCVDAAKSAINFLAGACRNNILCRDIQYHNFFMEGACYVLIFDIMQKKGANQHNLAWIRSALQCLRSMLPTHGGSTAQVPTTIETIERMVCAVFPDFTTGTPSGLGTYTGPSQQHLDGGAMAMASGGSNPSIPYGTQVRGQNQEQSNTPSEELVDFTAADVGLDFDFGTMDMDAFLSIDPSQDFDCRWWAT